MNIFERIYNNINITYFLDIRALEPITVTKKEQK